MLHDIIHKNDKIVTPKPISDDVLPEETMQTKIIGKIKYVKESQFYLDATCDSLI